MPAQENSWAVSGKLRGKGAKYRPSITPQLQRQRIQSGVVLGKVHSRKMLVPVLGPPTETRNCCRTPQRVPVLSCSLIHCLK